MAAKKPFANYLGKQREIASGDTIDPSFLPAASVNIKQTEVDFGTTPLYEKIFVIADVDVSAASQIIAMVAYEAPTGKDLDELEMDKLDIKATGGSGQLTLHISAVDGSYLADKFKINYLIG